MVSDTNVPVWLLICEICFGFTGIVHHFVHVHPAASLQEVSHPMVYLKSAGHPHPDRQLAVLSQTYQNMCEMKALCKSFRLSNSDCKHNACREIRRCILSWCLAFVCNNTAPAHESIPIPAKHTFESSLQKVYAMMGAPTIPRNSPRGN